MAMQRIPVEDLHTEAITQATQHVEGWHETDPDDGPIAWYEAVVCYGDIDEHDAECEDCDGTGEIDPDGTGEAEECPTCKGEGSIHIEGGSGHDGHPSDAYGTCQNEHCEHYGDRVDSAEGPMMNYWYPINDNAGEYGKDPLDLAAKIGHLPLCVVEVDDALGLALTGGGMDLSWQICAAFVAIGMAPPVHFAHLPAMAETWTEDRHERVYEAMRRSLEVQIGQHERALAELGNLKSRMINRSN